MKSPHSTTRHVQLVLGCSLALTSLAFAQTNAAPLEEDEDTVLLSPFKVSTTKDVGYLAGNTLAGSRLNTSLMDTGAAISVLTPELLKDIGATNMKAVILFQNNAVPEVGDSANNVNGNPLIGADEMQLRIRGLAASYARNFFKWDTSSDFFNVERIDQSRGPNSILFGFGAAGGIVNTSTKQANLSPTLDQVNVMFGSWDYYRGSFDVNQVLIPGKLGVRLNAVMEDAKSWREFEFNDARRAHLAVKYLPTPDSTLRVEFEAGQVKDNISRPWLAFDQSFLWRNAGRPTFSGIWNSHPTITSYWPDHLVVAEDGVVRNWIGRAYASNANGGTADTNFNPPTYSGIAETAANFAIIPRNSNLAGPDAVRDTDYHTYSAYYEKQISEDLTLELAMNHQESDFFGYDPNGGRAIYYWGSSTDLWGDASAQLPDASGNTVGLNPNAGKLFLENNWTRRHRRIQSTQLRGTAAYSFETGSWAKHRAAALVEYSTRELYHREDSEAFLNRPLNADIAEADVNRLFRRKYFQPGNSKDIHVASWRTPVANVGWVANQPLENTESSQNTGMLALQSFLAKNKIVTILGYRYDSLDYTYDAGTLPQGGTRDATTKQYRLDPASERSTRFNASTLTAGAVYHATKTISLFANTATSRDIPDVRIRVIGSPLPPMPDSNGMDFGLKFNLFDGRIYATAGYYTTSVKGSTDYGDVQTFATDRNTKILAALVNAGLITDAERNSRLINANGYLQDRDSDGWEFQLIANPSKNWRIYSNFSINNVVGKNSMAEVKAWAQANSAYWLSKAAPQGGAAFLTGNPWDAWDTLGNQISWMNSAIDQVVGLDGYQVRGQRRYGANLYTKYTFSDGILKNFSIGGGGRYQSANILGFYQGAIREGRSLKLFDASLSYWMKTDFIRKDTFLDLQINVSNVFNTDKSQVYTVAWWDPNAQIPGAIGLQEPRKIVFSATLKF